MCLEQIESYVAASEDAIDNAMAATGDGSRNPLHYWIDAAKHLRKAVYLIDKLPEPLSRHHAIQKMKLLAVEAQLIRFEMLEGENND